MRKLSLLLVFCLVLACFVSCGDDDTNVPTPTNTNTPEVTTEKPNDLETPNDKEIETDAPETPQDKWTERY